MIIGHQIQQDFLRRMVKRGQIPHALLFSGQSQLGKKTLAIEFAKLLIGKKNLESHPDFLFISPSLFSFSPSSVSSNFYTSKYGSGDAKKKKNEIQISQIRELIWKLSLRPYSASYKIAIIDKAHQMNQEAQNCFLKILEEPKGNSLLILITEHPEMLLPTILSRVQKIRFSPVKKTEIEKYLVRVGLSSDKARYFADFSLKKPGRAISFLEDENKIKNQKKLISDIEKIKNSDFNFRFQYAKHLSEKNHNIKEILNTWLCYFRSLLLFNFGRINFLETCAGLTSLNSISLDYDLSKLKKIINLIQSTDYLISTTNINPRLALEILLMEL